MLSQPPHEPHLSSCDLDTPGSPTSSTLISPRVLAPGSTCAGAQGAGARAAGASLCYQSFAPLHIVLSPAGAAHYISLPVPWCPGPGWPHHRPHQSPPTHPPHLGHASKQLAQHALLHVLQLPDGGRNGGRQPLVDGGVGGQRLRGQWERVAVSGAWRRRQGKKAGNGAGLRRRSKQCCAYRRSPAPAADFPRPHPELGALGLHLLPSHVAGVLQALVLQWGRWVARWLAQ